MAVHHIDDQSVQEGRVRDAVLCPSKEQPERSGPGGEQVQDLLVDRDQVVALGRGELRPGAETEYVLPVEGALALFVGALEDDQAGQLLDVLQARGAVVAQHIAEVPQPVHQGLAVSGAGGDGGVHSTDSCCPDGESGGDR